MGVSYAGSFYNFWDKMAKIGIFYSKYWTKLHQLFSFDRHTYADYKTETSFVVLKGTLLW